MTALFVKQVNNQNLMSYWTNSMATTPRTHSLFREQPPGQESEGFERNYKMSETKTTFYCFHNTCGQ